MKDNRARNGKTLGELFIAMHMATNPVTRRSYRQAKANRLERIERNACKGKRVGVGKWNE
jgi:hypothetical protein